MNRTYGQGFINKLAEHGMTKESTILTRLAKSPVLRTMRLTDPRIVEEVKPYLKYMRDKAPQEAAQLYGLNTNVGSFMDKYREFARKRLAEDRISGYFKPKHVPMEYQSRSFQGIPNTVGCHFPFEFRSRFNPTPVTNKVVDEVFNDLMKPGGLNYVSMLPYDDMVKTFGVDRANKLARRFIEYADSDKAALIKYMRGKRMSDYDMYKVLSTHNPRNVENLGQLVQQNVRYNKLKGPKYGLDVNKLMSEHLFQGERIPIRVTGNIDMTKGFTRRQRREISRQLNAEYRRMLGREPKFLGRDIRMFVDKYPVRPDESYAFNSSFNAMGGGSRSQTLNTLNQATTPFSNRVEKYMAQMRNSAIQRTGPLRPEISTSVVMDNKGNMFVPRDVFKHEAGHGMSINENPGALRDVYNRYGNKAPSNDDMWNIAIELEKGGYGGVLPKWHKPTIQNPFLDNRTFMEELSANLRGGIGGSDGMTPALASYADVLAETPAQREFAKSLAQRFGIYRPNPFSAAR